MARVLALTVIVGGETLPAGTEETPALKARITNPVAWQGESDLPADEPETPEEPPRGGPGSGKDVWRTYAEGLGVEVPADADRDAIVALVDARSSEK
ncbi:hypothetical protein [Modestobacter sp. VKM Ac-2985]|uniref:hypothetical protein n=1 Tax=Modestobacter sp. VKM Ac-2985 TaxID=3004139 RepID=UPI0022AB8AB4|nr:hypothetical protein [Modestobacter sp. VKM Ac-2985]MCZ2837143.1 hypothetical protein [Modestobacter sp. VKM Ac-2985]